MHKLIMLAFIIGLLGACDDPEPSTSLDTQEPGSDTTSEQDGASDSQTEDSSTADTGSPPGDTATADTSPPRDTQTPQDTTSTDTSTSSCPAQDLANRLGITHLAIGGSMSDDRFAEADFDLRYQYLAGNVPTSGPCESCATGCSVDGASCDNANGCAWWGCWQWDQVPPGQFVLDFIDKVDTAGAVPMIPYYLWYSVAGNIEGDAEIAALQQGALVDAYLADWRFLMETIARRDGVPVIVHIEPDLWGYAQKVNADPTQIPVALSAAADPACSGLPDTFAGLGRCMIAIARAEAPNALLGYHASAWAVGMDDFLNTDPNYDVAGDARTTADFLRATGADAVDLIVVEMSDRDAGFNNRWWDETDTALPHFTQAISWVRAVGEALSLPTLWWQVPYGHPGLEDACDRYSDNRVDYVFDHPERFSAAGSLGVAFGAGAGCMTTPDSDDGHFISRAQSYFSGTRPTLCAP